MIVSLKEYLLLQLMHYFMVLFQINISKPSANVNMVGVQNPVDVNQRKYLVKIHVHVEVYV